MSTHNIRLSPTFHAVQIGVERVFRSKLPAGCRALAQSDQTSLNVPRSEINILAWETTKEESYSPGGVSCCLLGLRLIYGLD